MPFLPHDIVIPESLAGDEFMLMLLGEEHLVLDYKLQLPLSKAH